MTEFRQIKGYEVIFLHYICFSISWFALVKYESTYVPGVTAYIALFILISKQPLKTMAFILLVSITGLSVDTIFITWRVMDFIPTSEITPLWYSLLWPLFATAVQSTLIKLYDLHISIKMLIGAGASFLAFHFGDQINSSIQINHMAPIILLWAILFPTALQINVLIFNRPLKS
jgi:hypothetical protein